MTVSLPQVQDMVHGVTTEECQAALQNHGWNVQRAIQYLKVRHGTARPPRQLPRGWERPRHPLPPRPRALSPCRWSSSSAWG